jgi:hypothetical protein
LSGLTSEAKKCEHNELNKAGAGLLACGLP